MMYVTSRQALAIGTRCPRLAGTCFRCTPPKRRSAHNWGALHCSRIEAEKGSEWTAASAADTCHKLCGDVGGKGSAPGDIVTLNNLSTFCINYSRN